MVITTDGTVFLLLDPIPGGSSNALSFKMIKYSQSGLEREYYSKYDYDRYPAYSSEHEPTRFNCYGCVIKLITDNGDKILVGGIHYYCYLGDCKAFNTIFSFDGTTSASINNDFLKWKATEDLVEIADMSILSTGPGDS